MELNLQYKFLDRFWTIKDGIIEKNWSLGFLRIWLCSLQWDHLEEVQNFATPFDLGIIKPGFDAFFA